MEQTGILNNPDRVYDIDESHDVKTRKVVVTKYLKMPYKTFLGFSKTCDNDNGRTYKRRLDPPIVILKGSILSRSDIVH